MMKKYSLLLLLLIIFSKTVFGTQIFNKNNNSKDKSIANLLETSKTFTAVAKEVVPTVVSIKSTIIVRTNDFWKKKFDDQELKDFFGEQYDSFPLPNEFRQKGAGSGIIVSENGYIITNVHVIEKAEEIEVTLYDKRTFSADVVGVDPLTEIAVVKIETEDLPVAELGNSDLCEIGEWVLAIGNPLELNSTVTAGIISAKGRDINIIHDTYGVENFIQTDAAINPGNSGGALVNMEGQVIGINTAIATENGYNQGYGFAIPINLAKNIMDDLINYGRVIRGYLGVSMQDIDEKKARALKLKKPIGVFIDSILDDGPALRAGLCEKDVLIKVDGNSVNDANIVQSLIARKNPGEIVELTVIRKNRIINLDVQLGERQYSFDIPTVKKHIKNYRYLGLELLDITKRLTKDLGVDGTQGVFVSSVERSSPAYENGIQSNDIILEVDEKPINSVEKFQKVYSNCQNGEVIIFKIKRENTTFHVFIEVNKN